MKACTPSIEPGITVTVSDAQTGAALDASVVLKEKNFQEKLGAYGAMASGQSIYGGAFERPGIYTITISKPGYQTSVINNVKVTKDECHVITRKLAIPLRSGERK